MSWCKTQMDIYGFNYSSQATPVIVSTQINV